MVTFKKMYIFNNHSFMYMHRTFHGLKQTPRTWYEGSVRSLENLVERKVEGKKVGRKWIFSLI